MFHLSLSLCLFLFSRVCQLLKCNRHEGDQPWLLPGVRYLFRPRAEKPRQLKEGKNNQRRGNVDAEENPYPVECYNSQKTQLLYCLYLYN